MERFHSKFDDALKEKLSGHSSGVPDSVWEGIMSEVASPNSQGTYYWTSGKRWMAVTALLLSLTVMGVILTSTRDLKPTENVQLAGIETRYVADPTTTIESSSSDKMEQGTASAALGGVSQEAPSSTSTSTMDSSTDLPSEVENTTPSAVNSLAQGANVDVVSVADRPTSTERVREGRVRSEAARATHVAVISDAEAQSPSSIVSDSTSIGGTEEQTPTATPLDTRVSEDTPVDAASTDPFVIDGVKINEQTSTSDSTLGLGVTSGNSDRSGDALSASDAAKAIRTTPVQNQDATPTEISSSTTPTSNGASNDESETSADNDADDDTASDASTSEEPLKTAPVEAGSQLETVEKNESGGAELPTPFDFSEDSLLGRMWSVDFSAGPSYNYRTLDIESNRMLQEHKNEYDNGLTTVTLKLNVRRRLGEKLFATAGLEYLRLGERYEYSSSHASHKADNRYDYYSIPLGLEFVQPIGLRTAVTAGLGGQYNMLRYGQSSWLDPTDFSPQSHSNDGGAHPFADNNFAVYGGVGLRYRLRDHIDLVIEQRATHLTNSVYKEEVGIEQLSYSFQTFFGLGVNF